MSKSYCGLFSGTMGALNTQQALTLAVYNEIVSTIASHANGHDLRQHKLPYKIPSAKRLKNLRQKRDNRTITKKNLRNLDGQNVSRNEEIKEYQIFGIPKRLNFCVEKWEPETGLRNNEMI